MPHSIYLPERMGTAETSPTGTFEAGSFQSYTLVYTAGYFRHRRYRVDQDCASLRQRHGPVYRYDASYALEVYTAHPGRFRLVKPVDPTDSGVADTIADWDATKGTVGIRLFLRDNVSSDSADPGINRVLATAA